MDLSPRWTVGPKFRGMKMIPPADAKRSSGIHLVTYNINARAPVRTGVFVKFAERTVRVWKWDEREEGFVTEAAIGEEEVERCRKQVRAMALDRGLAPYPLDQLERWTSLSRFIDARVLERCGIPLGVSVWPGDPDAARKRDETSQMLTPYFAGAPRVPHFTNIASAKPKGLKGSDLTAFHMDGSRRLRILLENETFFGPFDRDAPGRQLLGELQLAFLMLLCISSMQGLEQWKTIVKSVCSCDRAMSTHDLRSFFLDFLDVLEAQLTIVPKDFFIDPISSNNFMTECLADLDQNINELHVDHAVRVRFGRLKTFFRGHFGESIRDAIDGKRRDVETNDEEEERDEDDDARFVSYNQTTPQMRENMEESRRVLSRVVVDHTDDGVGDVSSNPTPSDRPSTNHRMAWMLPPATPKRE